MKNFKTSFWRILSDFLDDDTTYARAPLVQDLEELIFDFHKRAKAHVFRALARLITF